MILNVPMNKNFMYNILNNRTMGTPPRIHQETQLTREMVLERRGRGYLGRTDGDGLCGKARESPAAGGGIG